MNRSDALNVLIKAHRKERFIAHQYGLLLKQINQMTTDLEIVELMNRELTRIKEEVKEIENE